MTTSSERPAPSAWTPITAWPTIIAVLAYGLLCAGLGVLVHTTVLTHWKR